MDMITAFISIIALILINGFFAGSEAAIVASNKLIVENDSKNGNKRATLALKYINNSTSFFSVIQVGITFISFVNGFLAAETFTGPISELTAGIIPEFVIKIVITLILTYLQVIFGEIIPKKMAMKSPESFIYKTIRINHYFKVVTTPLVWILSKSANGLAKLLNIHDTDNKITEEEVKLLVLGSGKALKEQEKEMFEKILEFDDQIVSDIMTHRTELAAIEYNDSFEDVLKLIKEEQYSRYPVYKENIDNIVGILHAKDLLTSTFSKESNGFTKLLRKPHFVPEVMKTDDLFNEMRKTNQHMSIVIDEFGGTSGVVTMENIIEEIVGNIYDEHDDKKEEVIEIEENTYIVDGLVGIDYVEDIIHAGLPIDDYDTLSGFILGVLGRMPKENEAISFDYNNYLYEVLSYDDKLIKTIKVTKLESEEDNDNEDIDS